ncbi:hypothetical protein BcFMB_06560 [Bifidobacterium choerinum]|uniref:Uncharacterized protein n=1 Tax=Bifidobacterium choerinum TaxID=35760 RepID=A0A2D3D5G9_9BIFI|nr:hypothetical protein BcFMB_06560 [Bifidobacterium choerinum]
MPTAHATDGRGHFLIVSTSSAASRSVWESLMRSSAGYPSAMPAMIASSSGMPMIAWMSSAKRTTS